MMDFTRAISQRKDGQIKTDTVLDSLVRQMSVYTVATIGLFLILKEYLIGKCIFLCIPPCYSFAHFVPFSLAFGILAAL